MSCTIRKKTVIAGKTVENLIADYLDSLAKARAKGISLYDDMDEVKAMMKSASCSAFLRRCICNRKRHQQRISNDAVNNGVTALMNGIINNGRIIGKPFFDGYSFFEDFIDFEELYDVIFEFIGKGNTGISFSTVYDTAIRLGNCFAKPIRPEKYVYVHRHLVQAAKHLLGPKCIEDKCRIERKKFDAKSSAFTSLNALEIEDFLCVCYR